MSPLGQTLVALHPHTDRPASDRRSASGTQVGTTPLSNTWQSESELQLQTPPAQTSGAGQLPSVPLEQLSLQLRSG